MSNPNEKFNQFPLYLKTHELKAPTFLASNHYFIKDTGESITTFKPMETDEFVPSKIDFTSFLLPEDHIVQNSDSEDVNVVIRQLEKGYKLTYDHSLEKPIAFSITKLIPDPKRVSSGNMSKWETQNYSASFLFTKPP